MEVFLLRPARSDDFRVRADSPASGSAGVGDAVAMTVAVCLSFCTGIKGFDTSEFFQRVD